MTNTFTMASENVTWFDDIHLTLQQRIMSNTLHHGLLFSGPDGIGKTAFAHSLAKSLLCQSIGEQGVCGRCQGCLLFDAGSHPDFHLVQSDKQIGVDAIRLVSAKLNQTAQIGMRKVCVILQAETMTEAAANALLKTLEEPTADTYLILVSHARHKLLPTILSRCEKHKLSPPAAEQSMTWFKASYPEVSVSEPLLTLFGRAPLKLKRRFDDEKLPDLEQLDADLNAVSNGNKTPLAVAKAWENDAEILIHWCQRKAQIRFADSRLKKDHTAYAACLQANARLQQAGINKTLLLQSVVTAVV